MLDIRKLLGDKSCCCPLINEIRSILDKNARTRKMAMKALSLNVRDAYLNNNDKLIYVNEWLHRYYNDMIK